MNMLDFILTLRKKVVDEAYEITAEEGLKLLT